VKLGHPLAQYTFGMLLIDGSRFAAHCDTAKVMFLNSAAFHYADYQKNGKTYF